MSRLVLLHLFSSVRLYFLLATEQPTWKLQFLILCWQLEWRFFRIAFYNLRVQLVVLHSLYVHIPSLSWNVSSYYINWRYWQTGKNSHMRIKAQGRLVEARFIKIHQVFAKRKKVGYFSNRVVFDNLHSPWRRTSIPLSLHWTGISISSVQYTSLRYAHAPRPYVTIQK